GDGGVLLVVRVEVLEVGHAVAIAVDRRHARRAAGAPLDGVGDAVAVRVGVLEVGRAVAVGVARRRLVGALIVVADAVAVGVRRRLGADVAAHAEVGAVAARRVPVISGGGAARRGEKATCEDDCVLHMIFLSPTSGL